MNISIVSQPETQLGNEIDELLAEGVVYPRIVFVSAFVALRTILRLRERLLEKMANGARLRLTVGIDLGGTSREVLQELLRWNCETFVFHNTIARATFHPKVYFFESETTATLFIGSNNLTDGGFYTNYEAATRYDFDLPADAAEYERLVRPLASFLEPQGATIQQLNAALIATLVARGELPSEAEARQRRRVQARARPPGGENIPQSPFAPAAVPLPPLLPDVIRREERGAPQPPAQPAEPQRPPLAEQPPQPGILRRPAGLLVWRKRLPKTDALQVNEGSHPVGGVRLTQAHFENPPGRGIDQTTYFRQLFADYPWERELRRHRDQEHTFVPMRIIIRGVDYGVRNFEISHKPSGEAGQANYTSILRWGREFNPTVLRENLTNTVFSLYETAEPDADFLIEITEA
jgi:hypothetical protein